MKENATNVMSEFLNSGDFMGCSCGSYGVELKEYPDGTFQVVCGCGVSGPRSKKKQAAMHEWNMIQTAIISRFSVHELINLWCIERCRQKNNGQEDFFIEELDLSTKVENEDYRDLLARMGLVAGVCS